MSIAKLMTASAAAMYLLSVPGTAFAEAMPSAASKLSLVGSPAVQGVRATSLHRKNASQFESVPTWVVVLSLVAVGAGIAAAVGAFDGSSSP